MMAPINTVVMATPNTDTQRIGTEPPHLAIRPAENQDGAAISKLVSANVGLGHLLPRSPQEISQHVSRFLVASRDGTVLGCGELAPLTSTLAEVRSLVVSASARGEGIGTALLSELVESARRQGVPRLCAFTHVPHPFVALGFSILPHTWLPEKIMTDCQKCEWVRRCAQYAVVLELDCDQGNPRGRAR